MPASISAKIGVPVGKVPDDAEPLLAGQGAGDGQDGHHQGESADQHADAQGGVVPIGVCHLRPANAEPLLLDAEVKA